MKQSVLAQRNVERSMDERNKEKQRHVNEEGKERLKQKQSHALQGPRALER